MPPVIAFHPLGFIVREETRKDIIAQLLEIKCCGLFRDAGGASAFAAESNNWVACRAA
ncbi:MAG: hypothetical protein ABI146_02500 [Nitrobacter sp.]